MGTGIARLSAGLTPASVFGCGAANAAPAPVEPAPVVWTEPARYAFTLTTGCTRGFYEARYRITVRERDPADGHPTAFGFDQEAMAYDGGTCHVVTDYSA
ncbi:hypothetical protein [Actinoplanes sp. OR16]|uniref:hypothetical protein n=1 Tax=Actinoplanes sp. OR16 TaxID=946334 RepID=UPI000FDA5AC6|nr:hypothetical protein [Actinoplanes sp. OR16]